MFGRFGVVGDRVIYYGNTLTTVQMIKSPNQLEHQIIVVLCEIELFGTNIERYREIANLPDIEFVKRVFETHLNRNWECGLTDLHKRIDYLAGLPCELIPDELFRAAMQDAVSRLDWEVIAKDVDVAEKIQFLKCEN